MNQNLTIEETRDADLVWRIAGAPEVFDRITNDEWKALDRRVNRAHVNIIVGKPENHILLALADEPRWGQFMLHKDKVVLGCFVMDCKGNGVFEIHTMLLSHCRGLAAITAGKMAIEFAMQLDGVETLRSFCPADNPESYLYARLCGFHRAGIAAFKWVKHGISYPLKIVELSRKEYSPCLWL